MQNTRITDEMMRDKTSFYPHWCVCVEQNTQVCHSQTPHKVTIDSCNNQTIAYPEEIHKSL